MSIDNSKHFDTVEEYQQYQKEYQELLGYCKKIRQGIDSLEEKSGERAIWELIQNARDLSEDCHIRIVLDNDKIVFSHHGRPFDYMSLLALVNQNSSKDDKESEQVGRYGTGFMTTHAFNEKVYVSGPFEVFSNPGVSDGFYIIKDFLLDRSYTEPAEGVDEMRNEMKFVRELHKLQPRVLTQDEWTSFRYELSPEKVKSISDQLMSVFKLMPFVLVLNKEITEIELKNNYANNAFTFRRSVGEQRVDLEYIDNWQLVTTTIETSDNEKYICKSLQSKDGKDVVIIPPFPTCTPSIDEIPSLFLYFPLIGTEHFGVNFIFHSKRFYPVEKRNNIMLPENVDSKRAKGDHNAQVLKEMMEVLFHYYKDDKHTADLTLDMCKVSFSKDDDDGVRKAFYDDLQNIWKAQIQNWKVIPTSKARKSITDKRVRLLHPDFYAKLSDEQRELYEPTILHFASMVVDEEGQPYLMPEKNLIRWSETVNRWDCGRDEEFFITVENVCQAIKSKTKELHSFLVFLKDSGNEKLLDNYALLPSRNGNLHRKGELHDGAFLTDEVYSLVKPLMGLGVEKIFDPAYRDVCSVGSYEIRDLQNAISNTISTWRRETLIAQPVVMPENDKLKAMVTLCSAFSLAQPNSYRYRMIKQICKVFSFTFQQNILPKLTEDEETFYAPTFNYLCDCSLYFVSLKDSDWVKDNADLLHDFVITYASSTDKDRQDKLNVYGVIPNQNNGLCKKEDLLKNDGISDELADLYQEVINKDLHDEWVNTRYESLISEAIIPKDVAREIYETIKDELGQEKITHYTKPLRQIILKLNEDTDWQSWFPEINMQKETITFKMQSGPAQKSLFSLMDLADDDLNRLANLKEKGDIHEFMDKMEHEQELENERQSKFFFCLRIGKLIEDEIRKVLTSDIIEVVTRKEIGENLTVDDIQNGQDIIVMAKHNDKWVNIYYIEVKAKWNFETDYYAHMSTNQVLMAATHPDCYSLCCVDLSDKTKVNIPPDSTKEYIEQHSEDIIANTHVHLEIGRELSYMLPIVDADNDVTQRKIRLDNYRGSISKPAFQTGVAFDELVKRIVMTINESR